jgi:hypothetical protein
VSASPNVRSWRRLDAPAALAERLIADEAPTRPRALAVIDGVLAGRIWTDDAADPAWAVVIETGDGTVYAGGAIDSAILAAVLQDVVTASGDLIVGFSGPDDPLRAIVPADPYHRGEAIDFTDRVPPPDEAEAVDRPAPDGLRLVELDEALLPRTEWYEDTLHSYGSAERWTRNGIGRCLLAGREVTAQAMAGPRVRGLMEMGVATRGPYRRRGYGTLVSQLVARACEDGGDRVWWNTSAENAPSQAIARRLGYRHERRYDLVAYRTDQLAR